MEFKNIQSVFWQYVENQNTKISKKVLNWLNEDNLGSIIVDDIGKVYWLELVCSYSTLPKYAFNYIKKWCKKQGLDYMYDKFPA